LTDRTLAGETKAPIRQRRAVSPAQAYGIAVERHRAGRLDEAEQLYRAVLKLKPDHFGALHYLGLACTQRGKFNEALTLLQQAVALDPNSAEARTNLGLALAAVRRPEEAMAQYQQAIALQPHHAEARNNLGIVLQGLQRHEEAAAEFEAALRLQPDKAYVHNNLGTALAALDRHAEAVAACRKAIELNPRLAEACNNLGWSLAALDRHEEAVVWYQQAVALKPDYAEACGNLGAALNKLKRHDEAIAQFERALELDPGLAEAHADIGNALVALERHQEAVERYRRALAIRPLFAAAHRLLGSALETAGQPEEAIICHRRALAIKPEFAEAHNGLGLALITLGRLAEGRRAFETAIELAPTRGDFHRNLAMSKRFTAGDAQLQAMEKLARDAAAALDGDQRMELHYALGKAYADLGRREEALSQLRDANAIRRRKIKYDEAAVLAQLDRVKEVMTRELLERKAGYGAASDLPVFIVGMPRSGSTLIEQILASHPAVFGGGELPNFGQTMADLCHPAIAPAQFTELVPDLPGERLGEIGARYLDSVRALAPDARRITDKLLGNYRMAGLIHLALPGARIIHARRDPLDTCLSCFEQYFFGSHQAFSYDLAELGRYYRAYDTLMAHWRDVLPEGVMLEVQYEELVTDFEPQARRIVAHCGLDWDARCLAFHKTERAVHTVSAVQVRQPLYRSSVGRWQPVRHLLRPLLDELGADWVREK
jgi:tetratricopeptide (TPR) repeat protein